MSVCFQMNQISWLKFCLLCCLAAAVLPPVAIAQTSPAVQLKPKFTLDIVKGTVTTVTLQAQNAQLSDIVAQLVQKTGVPIVLSPKLKAERVTIKIMDAPLPALLAELAPHSYADYVVSGGWNRQPRCLGFFLQAQGERQPANEVNIAPRAQSFLMEGNTEDDTAPAQAETNGEPPLQVGITQGLLTVRAKQQPLTVVLYKIADSYRVPFEMRNETAELIDLNVQAATPVELLRVLPTGTQLYYRRNLQSTQDRPLRFILEKTALRKTLREQRSISHSR